MTQLETSLTDNLAVTFVGPSRVEASVAAMPTPAAGELLMRTSRTLISTGTELTVLHRRFDAGTAWDQWAQYPFQAGYCAAGVVADTGDGVSGWTVGQRVAGWAGHRRFGTSPADRSVAIPDTVSDEEAAWMPMGVIAEWGFRKANVLMGETVAVVGVGILGQLVVQLARLAGAAKVIAIDPAQSRLDMAATHGATHTLAMPVDQAIAQVRDITGGRMAEVCFEMTGNAAVFAPAQDLLGDFGRMVLIGDTGFLNRQTLSASFLRNNLTLIGAHQRLAARDPVWNHGRLGTHFLEAIGAGQLHVRDLITHRFKAADAAQAYDVLATQRDRAMGVVLDFCES